MRLPRTFGAIVSEPRSSILPVREIALILLLGRFRLRLPGDRLLLAPRSRLELLPGRTPGTTNLVGESGALVADIVLFSFGWVAYALPLALLAGGLRLLRRSAAPWSWPVFGTRLLGWLSAATAACVLVGPARRHDGAAPGRRGAGGIIGDWLGSTGMPFLNWAGVTLVAVAVLMIGIQAALGYSWIRIAEGTGRSLHHIVRGTALPVWRALRAARARGDGPRAAPSRPRGRTREERAGERAPPSPHAPQGGCRSRDAGSRRTRRAERAAGQGGGPTHPTNPAEGEPAAAPATMPDLALLEEGSAAYGGFSGGSLEEMSRTLEHKLADFGIEAEVTSVLPGPVVTRFEIQPAAGIKVSRISTLAKDLARSLAVVSVRIVEVIPGKSVVGIEIPNEQRETVRLKDTLTSQAYRESDSPLTIALGMDIAGQPVVTDIGRMPHLLIAGTTGSGKSVGVNAMLLSMLYKATPEELRLILIDPKILELSVYEGIPHLLTQVVTDMKDAAQALHWCVAEMERRYRLMAALRVRNIEGLNRLVDEATAAGEPIDDPLWPEDAADSPPELDRLPLIVVVIDELADLMMTFGKKVDQFIARIAQKARAAGIHLVLATQRPSVDVITGLIKANVPARMSYQVSSRIDSRTILDQGGAEQLLGYGDMLFLPPGTSIPIRVHGAFVSDREVLDVVADWKARGAPDYRDDVLTGPAEASSTGQLFPDLDDDTERSDALYDEAVAFVIESRRPSISAVQRKLRIGYNRAARLIEAMEEAGIVSAMNGNGSREVLVPTDRADP